MVTPNLSNLNTRQILQLQEQRRISSQQAAVEILRRRATEDARRRRQEIDRERIAEVREAQQAEARFLSSPRGRQLAEESFRRARAERPIATTRVALTRAQEIAQERLQQAREMQAAEARTLSTPEARSAALRSFERVSGRQVVTAPTAVTRPRAEPPLSRFTVGNQVNLAGALRQGVSQSTLRQAGFEERDINEAQKRANVITRIERFQSPAGFNLRAATREVSPADLQVAGFTSEQIRTAKARGAAADKLKPFTDDAGNINLDAARRGGADRNTLKNAGFTKAQIAESQLRVASLRRLRPYAVSGGYDIVAAVDAQVSPVTLRGAGFTQQQITEAQELNRNLNPAPGTRAWYLDVGKNAGVTVADAIIPGVWVRNWNNLSNTERATNIALDALFLVPFVGIAAKGAKAAKVAGSAAAAARAAKRTSKGGQALNAVRRTQASDTATRIANIDEKFTGIARRQQIERLTMRALQAPPGARQRTATTFRKDISDRIAKIDEQFAGAERKAKIETLLANTQAATNRAQDAALLRTADEVAKIVLRKTGNSVSADAARKASIEVGEGLATGNAALVKSASRKLSDIGKRSGLKALTSRGKALETKSVNVTDFFKGARSGDIPKAPRTVEDRIKNIDEFFQGAEKLDATPRVDTPTKLLEREINIAEKKLKDLERSGTGTPQTRRLLQERIQRTRVQVAERPRVSPKLQTLLTTQPGGPLARVETRTLARSKIAPPKARAVKLQTKKAGVKSVAAPVRQTLLLQAKPILQTQVKTKVVPLTKTITATQLAQLPKSQVQLAPKVATKTKVATLPKDATKVKPVPKTKVQPATATKVQPATAVKVQPVPATAVKLAPATKVKTAPATKVRTAPLTQVRQTTRTKVQTAEFSRFKVPNEREQKKLKPGEFPRVITFQQGLFDVTVDIDRGTRSFSRADSTGRNITPQSTFKIVTKDKSRPTAKTFRQGVVDVIVTPRSLSFAGRRQRNLLRSGRQRPI